MATYVLPLQGYTNMLKKFVKMYIAHVLHVHKILTHFIYYLYIYINLYIMGQDFLDRQLKKNNFLVMVHVQEVFCHEGVKILVKSTL